MSKQNVENARRYIEDLHRFVRDFVGGVRADDVRRLFHNDATAAYQVLSRDSDDEPTDGSKRFLYRAKAIFLGLAFQLTPARRLLFCACLLFAVLGLIDFAPRIEAGRILVNASPFWFFWSIGGLVFLLMLELVDQVRVRDELEVARQLQVDLLPTELPQLQNFRIAHSYKAANEVGGDYYDFVELADGRVAILVGDASGHGMAAGLLMAIAKSTAQLALDINPRPIEVLKLLNKTLFRTGDRRAFMSLFYGLLDPKTGQLEYASAGHPFPMLRRADGQIEELGVGGLPLGIRPELQLTPLSAVLNPGDLLLLYSDGLPEALDPKGNDFGYERMRSLLERGGSAKDVHERVRGALDLHIGSGEPTDDFSLVVLRRMVVPPPPPQAPAKGALETAEVSEQLH